MSPYHIHRHPQLLGDHLGHLGVHPLTHLNPPMGNGNTPIIVVDGNVDSVPGVRKGISMFSFKGNHLVPNWLCGYLSGTRAMPRFLQRFLLLKSSTCRFLNSNWDESFSLARTSFRVGSSTYKRMLPWRNLQNRLCDSDHIGLSKSEGVCG